MPGSVQAVDATAGGVSMTIGTSGLTPGHAYTAWINIFEHPEFCIDSVTPGLRCGPLDFFNPLADLTCVYIDGLVATEGRITFDGYRPTGIGPDGNEQVAWGDGVLDNPLGAEYQSIVRSHGPADARYPDQTTSLNGGCRPGDSYTCLNEQASGFGAEGPFRILRS